MFCCTELLFYKLKNINTVIWPGNYTGYIFFKKRKAHREKTGRKKSVRKKNTGLTDATDFHRKKTHRKKSQRKINLR